MLSQLIAEAMMAVLPGIDANDETKTAAVFQFYTAGRHKNKVGSRPLYARVFAEGGGG